MAYLDPFGGGGDPTSMYGPDPEELRRQAMLNQLGPAPTGAGVAPPNMTGPTSPNTGVTGGMAPSPSPKFPGYTPPIDFPVDPGMGRITPGPSPFPMQPGPYGGGSQGFIGGTDANGRPWGDNVFYGQQTQTSQPSAFNYEKARDSWMSGQYGSGEAGARAWAQANGVPYNGGDTITLPNGGGSIDIIGNFAGGAGNGQRMANNWTPAGGNGLNPGGQGAPAVGTAYTPYGGDPFQGLYGQSGGAPGTGPLNATVADYGNQQHFSDAETRSLNDFIAAHPGTTLQDALKSWTPGLQTQMRSALMEQMRGAEQPIDENALGIRQPFQAAQLAAQRQQDQERNALAEQMYASGQGAAGSGSELGQRLQQSAERNAVGLAGIKAGLVGNEVAAKRTQLAQALQLANSIGARQEAQQLQRELAALENKYRYAQLGQQESQFGRSLGFNQGQWNDQYGLARQAMLNQMNTGAFNAGAY